MPTLRQVTLRHAQHFEGRLREAESLYLKGGDTLSEALAQFDEISAHVRATQTWADGQAEDDEQAALVNVAYENAGPHLFDLRQHPHDRVQMLEKNLSAARRFNLHHCEVSLLNNLAELTLIWVKRKP